MQSSSDVLKQLTPEERQKVQGVAEFLLWREQKRLRDGNIAGPTSEGDQHEPRPHNR